MLTRRTIEAAASATLESISEMFDGSPAEVAQRAVAEEAFADVAVHQLLKLTGDGMRARAVWPGYQGVAIVQRLLDEFIENVICWEPVMSLAVAETALAIAKNSERATAALLFRVHKEKAIALCFLNLFEAAFRSLNDAEEFAPDTRDPQVHYATLLNCRAAVSYEMARGPDALEFIMRARNGFLRSGDHHRVRETHVSEAAILTTLGRYDDARRLMERCLADAESTGDHKSSALHLGNLGHCLARTGDIKAARSYLNAAGQIYAAQGCSIFLADIVATLAVLEVREHGIEAMSRVERACADYDRLGRRGDSAWIQLEAAKALLTVDSTADIIELCHRASTRALELGMNSLAEDALRVLNSSSRSSDRPM
jgi:tetratricopeptide (TPR) repeat protein